MPLIDPLATPAAVFSMATDGESFWSRRDEKITRFRDLVRQIDTRQRVKRGQYTKFEGNEAGTFFSTMTQLLSKHAVKHRIPLGFDAESERELKGQIERLIDSVYRDVDYRRARRIDPGKLQSSAAKFACSDGWVVAELVKYDDREHEPIDIRLYDTLDVAPQWGPEDLVSAVIKTRRTRLQVAMEYPGLDLDRRQNYNPRNGHFTLGQWRISDPYIDVYTCYYLFGKQVYYGVVCNGQWALEPYVLDWTKRIPMVIMPFNGLPYKSERRPQRIQETSTTLNDPSLTLDLDIDDWTCDVGRGIFFMNERLYETFNELWSNILDIIQTEGRGTYWKRTDEGEDNELTIGRGKDAVNALAEGEEVGRLPPGQLSEKVAEMLGAMSGMLQRGGVSWQLMGQAGQYQSGFAINQLISAAMTIATPYLEGLKSFYQQLDELVIDALKSLPQDTLTIRAYKEKSFVEEQVDLSLLKDRRFYFDVDIKPGLPEDLMSRIQAAQVAKREKLLDDWTILDEVVAVDDPELILDRLDEQEILNLPSIRLRRMAAQMLEKGDMPSAVAIMQELSLLQGQNDLKGGTIQAQLMQLQGMMGQAQGAGMGADIGANGMGGMGPGGGPPTAAPAQAENPMIPREGVSPGVLPPEMMGVQPAEMRANSGGGFLQAIRGLIGG